MAMARPSIFIFVLAFLLVSGFVGAHELKPTKLFVFGDSYADTGNHEKLFGDSWKVPYGITNPGKPAGRFSDGIIFTDYLAIFLGLQTTPLSYTLRNQPPNDFTKGMNFAFGGTGVFLTIPGLPDMSSQIDYFEQLISSSHYTKNDVESAVFLVTLSGNDYVAFFSKGGSIANINIFISSVVNQLVTNLKRIQQLGAKKIIVGGLPPLGCLPIATESMRYNSCVDIENSVMGYHNTLLRQAIDELNSNSPNPTFHLIDFYQAFQNVITTKRDYEGKVRFTNPLAPCCQGTVGGYNCGRVDMSGKAMYTVCSDPSTAFFWDGLHPSQAGWRTVFTLAQKNISQFLGL